MPLDSELFRKLEQRRSESSRTPTPCKASNNDSRHSEDEVVGSRVDEELAAKLRRRQAQDSNDVESVVSSAKNSNFQAPIDAELVEKLKRRQQTMHQKTEVQDGSAGGASFQAPIDMELAEKLKRRKSTIRKQETAGYGAPESMRAKQAELENTDGELAQKLTRRRHLNGEGTQVNATSATVASDIEEISEAPNVADGTGKSSSSLVRDLLWFSMMILLVFVLMAILPPHLAIY